MKTKLCTLSLNCRCVRCVENVQGGWTWRGNICRSCFMVIEGRLEIEPVAPVNTNDNCFIFRMTLEDGECEKPCLMATVSCHFPQRTNRPTTRISSHESHKKTETSEPSVFLFPWGNKHAILPACYTPQVNSKPATPLFNFLRFPLLFCKVTWCEWLSW
jgi:hypothetical protein